MFHRFKDLTWNDINCDLQVHTNRTDGQASVSEILKKAQEVGLKKLAFTEHVRKDTQWFEDFVKEVRLVKNKYHDIQVLVGCEVKTLDEKGTLDISTEILATSEIILGSVHRFPNESGGFLDFKSLDKETFARIEFELALGMLKNAPIHVLSHPGGMYARHYSDLPEKYLGQLLEKSINRKIAVELNSSYINDFNTVLNLFKEINPYVSIGSDVHRLDEIGKCRDQLKLYGVGQL